jgi:MFS transporter, DHA2 family, multidrug resistance protein
VVESEQLSGPLAAELLDVAREAFTQGMQVAALTSAVVAAMTAVLAAVFLRRIRAGSEPVTPPHLEPSGAPVAAAAAEQEQ